MTDAAIGELIGDRYVLVEHLRGGTTGDEWDAVDRRLHRHVIVSFAMPRSGMPVDDGDEPTMAMPVPVADRRRVLDGGVQDGRSYLVLEHAIDVTAPTPSVDPDPTEPIDLGGTIDLRTRTEPTRPIAPRPDQQRTRVFTADAADSTRTSPTTRTSAPVPPRDDTRPPGDGTGRRRRFLAAAIVGGLALLLVGSIAALAMARDGDTVDVTPSTIELPVTTEAPPPTTAATTSAPTTTPVTTRRPVTTTAPTTTATTEPEATTETTVEPVGGIEPIVTAPTTVPAPVTTPAPIITVATTAAPTPTTALAIIEPSEPTVGEPAAGEPVAG